MTLNPIPGSHGERAYLNLIEKLFRPVWNFNLVDLEPDDSNNVGTKIYKGETSGLPSSEGCEI